MKKKITVITVLIICMLTLLCGCECEPVKQTIDIYFVNCTYSFDDSYQTLIYDKQSEQFIFHYEAKDGKERKFSFGIDANVKLEEKSDFEQFNTSSPEYPKYDFSGEFDITDIDGNEIIFDENGDYSFYGDKIFIISYKNANQLIKDKILKGECYFFIYGIIYTNNSLS